MPSATTITALPPRLVTDQFLQPCSALTLAWVLQLTDTAGGARFWWQYAAGAGQPAAYSLYLHHQSLGEEAVTAWWRDLRVLDASTEYTGAGPAA